MLHLSKPTFVVMALASDAPSNAKVAWAAARRLEREAKETTNSTMVLSKLVTVMAAPGTWALSDFENQCINDPLMMLGGLILFNVTSKNGSDNFVIWSHSWTELDGNAALVECSLSGNTNVLWLSDVGETHDKLVQGYKKEWSVTLGPVAALTSFFVSQNSTQTTYNYAPPNPLPAPGATYAAQTQQTSNTLGEKLPTLALALGIFSTVASGSAVTVPGTNADVLLAKAAHNMAKRLFDGVLQSEFLALQSTTCANKETNGQLIARRCYQWFKDVPPTQLAYSPTTGSANYTPAKSIDGGSFADLAAFLSRAGGYSQPMPEPTYQPNLLQGGLENGIGGVVDVDQVQYAASESKGVVTIAETSTHPRFDAIGTPLCTIRASQTSTFAFSEYDGKNRTLSASAPSQGAKVATSTVILYATGKAAPIRRQVSLSAPTCGFLVPQNQIPKFDSVGSLALQFDDSSAAANFAASWNGIKKSDAAIVFVEGVGDVKSDAMITLPLKQPIAVSARDPVSSAPLKLSVNSGGCPIASSSVGKALRVIAEKPMRNCLVFLNIPKASVRVTLHVSSH